MEVPGSSRVATRDMASKYLQRLIVILGGLGGLVFILSLLAHSRTLWVVGITLMVTSLLLAIPFYLSGSKGNRTLSAVSVILVILFAIWLAVPSLHGRAQQPLLVGLAFSLCAFGLSYAWWRANRREGSR